MKRRRMIRRKGGITPQTIEARRLVLSLADAEAECERKRAEAEQRRDFELYHSLLSPCSDSCACKQRRDADMLVRDELGLMPWDFFKQREVELFAEIDRLIEGNEA